jgi:hypothetical protein
VEAGLKVRKRSMFHLILVCRYWIRSRMSIKFLDQGLVLVVLQVASKSMETQDAHKNILLVLKVGHCFDVFDMAMLKNTHKG